MTEDNKFALRAVMADGYKLIAICCESYEFRIYNPVSWYRHYRFIKGAGIIARWLQKLAFYSAVNFEGFIEDHFWQEYEDLLKKLPIPNGSFHMFKQDYEHTLDRITS